ncbi:MAG: tRNA lysidine(34) synthetase TilS [Candidatus Omnitrophica bacterium]|nr:tRNA lysidine(34) synthetase TilS [Candidatus Omnitrophota bacterium]
MIIKKVKEFIQDYRLIEKNDRIVVGVSGGADSVALIYILNRLKREMGFYLHIAHLDHMLRLDSSKDKEFVENLAKKLNLPFSSASINIKELAHYSSIEQIARNVRLAFLFKVAKDIKAKKIALGHNFDDQAETVLMRILRGAGLYGLCGILPKRGIYGFTIIRPLLGLRRKEIENYLKKKKLKFCQDYTNLKDIYFRNRIRHHLLPLLENRYNKNIRRVLVNMAESIGYDYEYLLRSSQKAFSKKARVYGRKRIVFNLKEFLNLDTALQRMLIRVSVKRIKGDLRHLEFRHIREIEDLLYKRPHNSVVDLPKGVFIIKTNKSISIMKR